MKKNEQVLSSSARNKNFQLEYDKEGDILYLTRGKLTKEDTSEELGDDVSFGKTKRPKK